MTSKSTVEEIAEFADGCANSAIQPDVRDIDPHHPFDSIGCAIGVMGAKVTQDIKALVDVFGGNQMCTLKLVKIESGKRFEKVRRPLGGRPTITLP